MSSYSDSNIWTDDPSVLLFSHPHEILWSDKGASFERRQNAIARFAVLWTIFCLVGFKDTSSRVTALAAGAIMLYMTSAQRKPPALVSILENSDEPLTTSYETNAMRYCQAPTPNNPAANALIGETFGPNDQKLPACPPHVAEKYMKAALKAGAPRQIVNDPISWANYQRTFLSTPANTVPPDRTAFLQSIFGDKGVRRTYDIYQWPEAYQHRILPMPPM